MPTIRVTLSNDLMRYTMSETERLNMTTSEFVRACITNVLRAEPPPAEPTRQQTIAQEQQVKLAAMMAAARADIVRRAHLSDDIHPPTVRHRQLMTFEMDNNHLDEIEARAIADREIPHGIE